VERSSGYKLINLADTGRGEEGSGIRPIAQFPLSNEVVGEYDWPPSEVPKV
jgi:hypothetical protein